MSLHFQELGSGLSSQKIIELLMKVSNHTHDNEIKEYGESFDQFLADGEYKSIVQITLKIITQTVSDKTLLQPLYAAVIYFITQIEDQPEQAQLIEELILAVEQIGEQHAVFKTKIVAQIFNSFPPQISLFYKLLDFANKHRTQNIILPSIVQNLDGFIGQFKLKNASELLSRLLQSVQNNQEQAATLSEYILNYGQTSQEQYLAAFVRYQNVNTSYLKFNQIATSAGFKALSKTVVSQLVQEVMAGNITECQELLAKEKEAFEKLNLNAAVYMNLARISKLLHLPNRSYTYSQIKQILGIEDVETWIIQAIQQKNIEAQIDQLNETIYIMDNSMRVLTKQDWKELHDRLSALLSKIKGQ